MMNFIIYVNDTLEEERALYDLDNKKILLKGDYYHDKIDYQIMGYLLALGVDEDDVPTEYIDGKHEMFDELEFYDNDYHEEDDEDDTY